MNTFEGETIMKYQCRFLILSVLAALAISSVAFAQVGPPGGTIYANNQMFKTVGTPTNLPNHGKFDTIYAFDSNLGLANVADAAPGDMAYNGGRWEVRPVQFLTIAPTQFTNATDLHAAAAAGEISIGDVVRRFECPLIPKR
jgi:hypothetical protein